MITIATTKEDNFKIKPAQLNKAITPKTKLLILNSPSNPTGMVYAKAELEAIARALIKKDVFCVSDEIYEKIIYDNQEHISIASLSPDIKKRTLVINGVSKSYAMTGWRIGYAAGPVEIIQAMNNLQSHSTSNPTSISQKAAVAALTGPPEQLDKMVDEFKKRRDYMMERLSKLKGLSCLKPQGAFYVFVDISNILGKSYGGARIKDSFSLAEILLSEANVAVVPGSVFGADGYIRLSFATSMENISKGLDRIKEFITKL